MESRGLKQVTVWDRPTRLIHWINFLSVLLLLFSGLIIYNGKSFGIPTDGKILLKTLHVFTGYVFSINLLWRLVWAFVGNEQARFKAFLPFGRGYIADIRNYLAAIKSGHKQSYLGHNPLGKLAVTTILIALMAQLITGLVLAGTDLYFPPFGSMIAEWVAASGVDPSTLAPYQKEFVDPAAFQEMRALRRPIGDVHVIVFYALSGLIILHIAAVIWTEIKEGGTIISAMFTGKKTVVDDEDG